MGKISTTPLYLIQVRSATNADINELVSLLSADATGQYPNDPPHDIPATLRCPAAKIFIAEQEGKIVGTLTASWNGRNGELRYFWADPALRHTKSMRTIFDGLYGEAMQYLRAVGMRRILFFVRRSKDVERQIQMYKRELGAEIVDPVTMAISLSK